MRFDSNKRICSPGLYLSRLRVFIKIIGRVCCFFSLFDEQKTPSRNNYTGTIRGPARNTVGRPRINSYIKNEWKKPFRRAPRYHIPLPGAAVLLAWSPWTRQDITPNIRDRWARPIDNGQGKSKSPAADSGCRLAFLNSINNKYHCLLLISRERRLFD